MFTWILATCALLAPVPDTPARSEVRGPSPTLVQARVDKEKGQLLIVRSEVVMVPETRTETVVLPNGRTENRTVTRFVTVPRQVEQTYELKLVQATDAGGKELDAATLTKRLRTPTVVLLSADGQPVDAGYRKALNKDTVVLRVPSWGPNGKPAAMPPPPAKQ
jgi:hypothetical protein